MTICDFIDEFIIPTGDYDLHPENVTLARDLRACCKEQEVKWQDVIETIRATTGCEHRPRGLVLGGRRLNIYLGFRLLGYRIEFDGGRGGIAKAITRIAKLKPQQFALSDLRRMTDMPNLTMRQIMSASNSHSFVASRIVAPDEKCRNAEAWFEIVLAGSPCEESVRQKQRKHPHHLENRKRWAKTKVTRVYEDGKGRRIEY